MVRFALAFGALCLLACNGCNDGSSPPPNPGGSGGSLVPPPGTGAPAGGETLIQAEDDGKTFDVARGAPVTFKLAGNAGTGYLWTLAQVDANVLAQQGERTSEVGSGLPGGPKLDVFRFIAQAPGSTVVAMDYKRPFGNAGPARSLHVTINVH